MNLFVNIFNIVDSIFTSHSSSTSWGNSEWSIQMQFVDKFPVYPLPSARYKHQPSLSLLSSHVPFYFSNTLLLVPPVLSSSRYNMIVQHNSLNREGKLFIAGSWVFLSLETVFFPLVWFSFSSLKATSSKFDEWISSHLVVKLIICKLWRWIFVSLSSSWTKCFCFSLFDVLQDLSGMVTITTHNLNFPLFACLLVSIWSISCKKIDGGMRVGTEIASISLRDKKILFFCIIFHLEMIKFCSFFLFHLSIPSYERSQCVYK